MFDKNQKSTAELVVLVAVLWVWKKSWCSSIGKVCKSPTTVGLSFTLNLTHSSVPSIRVIIKLPLSNKDRKLALSVPFISVS